MDPVSTPSLEPLLGRLGLTLEGGIEPTVVVEPDSLLSVAQALKMDGFMLLDAVGVDYLSFVQQKPARYCVLYNIYAPEDGRRLFLRAYVPESGPTSGTLPTLFPVWRSANYLEREVYDLIGVVFEGHPDLRKVLTPDDLEGHPLRKDFPLGESPTLFKDGRFLDPAAFRAGMTGQQGGLTGFRGGLRRGETTEPVPPQPHPPKPAGGEA